MEWSESLLLGQARMDDTHREFVEYYNAFANAPEDAFFERFDAFIQHTVAHFDQENRWMEKVGFPGCHRAEHDRVLEVIREVRKRAEAGDRFLAKRLLEELPQWFDSHVNGMDAALAFHLDTIGFDVESEILPEGVSCGSTGAGCSCSTAAMPAEA